MRIFITCSLITPTSLPIHLVTIEITSTLYPGRLSLILKASCSYFCLLSLFFPRTFFSHGQAISTRFIAFLSFYSIVTSVFLAFYSFFILYSKSQIIFTCSFSNTALCPHMTLHQAWYCSISTISVHYVSIRIFNRLLCHVMYSLEVSILHLEVMCMTPSGASPHNLH